MKQTNKKQKQKLGEYHTTERDRTSFQHIRLSEEVSDRNNQNLYRFVSLLKHCRLVLCSCELTWRVGVLVLSSNLSFQCSGAPNEARSQFVCLNESSSTKEDRGTKKVVQSTP